MTLSIGLSSGPKKLVHTRSQRAANRSTRAVVHMADLRPVATGRFVDAAAPMDNSPH